MQSLLSQEDACCLEMLCKTVLGDDYKEIL